MKRAAVAIGLGLGLAFGIVSAASGSVRTPSRLMVSAKEWSLIASRQSLKPGPARIQLYNAGEDAHDLRLRRVGGTRTLAIAETAPGDLAELRAVLRRGRWKLWCSLPGHAKAGMRATLIVRP
jgi:hypothetical protein